MLQLCIYVYAILKVAFPFLFLQLLGGSQATYRIVPDGVHPGKDKPVKIEVDFQD